MPHLVVSEGASVGLERCRRFLVAKSIEAARKAVSSIRAAFQSVTVYPESGRLFDAENDLRELLIPFGETGYVALYRWDVVKDAVIVLAFRHQREAGW